MTPITICYPIPGNEGGGLLKIYGERTAKHVVLYCGGFPDGVEPFLPMARRLAASRGDDDDDGCFVGVTCFPGFDDESYHRLNFRDFRREGFSFSEVTCCIREAAKQLFLEYNKKTGGEEGIFTEKDEGNEPQFTVIFHDWGVMPGMMFVNRSIVEGSEFSQRVPDRVVLLDVLLPAHRSISRFRHLSRHTIHEQIVYLAYRGSAACSFAMMKYISETVGLLTFVFLFVLLKILRLQPTRSIDNDMVKERNINRYHLIYMCYPYYYLFQAILSNIKALSFGSLPLDLARTPVLYIYGAEKNVVSLSLCQNCHYCVNVRSLICVHSCYEMKRCFTIANVWHYCSRRKRTERVIAALLG